MSARPEGSTMSSRGEFGQVAARLRRPGWRDPRLLVGVVRVALAVALGAWTVGQADRTAPVLVAHGVLTPGQPLSGERVGVMRVHLADASRYLSSGAVITRTVGDGELIPRSSVGAADGLGLRPIAVPVEATLADGVRPGARVDLWFTPDRDSIAAGAAPHAVAEGLTVVEVGKDTGSFSISSGTTVQVLVPIAQLPAVLGALAADGSVTIVPIPGWDGAAPR